MMNIIPGKYHGKLTSSFMLIHGVRPDQRTWITLISLCYFHNNKDNDASRYKNQAHTLDKMSLADHQHLMPSLSIIHATSNTMNPTTTDWVPTNFPHQFILLLYTMVDNVYFCTGRTLLPLTNLIHLALELRMSIHTQTPLDWILQWISQWIPINLHTTWSNLMMAPPNPFHLQIFLCWSKNHRLMLWTLLIFSHLS